MLAIYILFWVILIWGLRDGDIYPKEAIIVGIVWALLLVGSMYFPGAEIGFIVAIVLLDIYLILKVFGGDIGIR